MANLPGDNLSRYEDAMKVKAKEVEEKIKLAEEKIEKIIESPELDVNIIKKKKIEPKVSKKVEKKVEKKVKSKINKQYTSNPDWNYIIRAYVENPEKPDFNKYGYAEVKFTEINGKIEFQWGRKRLLFNLEEI